MGGSGSEEDSIGGGGSVGGGVGEGTVEDAGGGGGRVVEDSHALHRVSSWPVKGSQLGLIVV